MSRSRRTAAAVLACALTAAPLVAVAGPAHAGPSGPTYYVSLGDSLAAGYQPDSGTDEPDVAYTHRLYESLKKHDPDLVHVNLGCSGETTATMISGGRCDDYAAYGGADNQLDAATWFLAAHRGQVAYVTVDIGANDVNGCLPGGQLDLDCLGEGMATVAANAPKIDAALRAAGGTTPVYGAMTYYNPFLAAWMQGTDAGRGLATMSVTLATNLNSTLADAATRNGFRVADVATAFSSDAMDTLVDLGGQQVPLNVARICQWTWMCTSYTDIHANDDGHAVIARTFLAALTATPPPVTEPPAPPRKATTRTTARLVGKHRISTKKRAKVRVRVRAARGAKPRGVLVVKDRKRVLKRVRVGASGARRVTLPRLKRAGKHRITVTYKGSAKTRASRSNVVRLRVVRR